MSETTERLDAITARLDAATPGAITITPSDIDYLRKLARKQAAALEAVEALAKAWESRGEHDMKFSKSIPDEDIAMAIPTEGASKVENARHIRAALEATL